jgi:hypothetical protein
MSKDATRAIDPRFDARFQRGYASDAAAPAPPEAEADARAAAPPPTAPDTRTPRAEAPPRTVPAHPVPRPAPGIRSPEATAQRPVAQVTHEQHHVDLLAEMGFVADAADEHADPGMRRREPAKEEQDLPVDSVPQRARFWIALGASVAFVVAGAALTWNAMNSQMSPTGRMGMGDQVTQQMMQSLGAGLVQAGSLGAIVVLAIWAVSGLRRSAS